MIRHTLIDAALLCGLALVAPGTSLIAATTAATPKAAVYDPAHDASADVDSALARAAAASKLVIIAMGADWCHDSQSLAARFATPKFAAMLAARYEVVLVDVGQRDRNIDIARRFGVSEIVGTPTVLIVSARGELLNRADAPSWRNAASRSDRDVFAYFEGFAPPR